VIQDLTLETFTPLVGERFRIHATEQRSIDVELVEASALGATTATPRRQPFSLVFRAAGGELVPQRIYRVEHEQMGALDIFLVPIGPDGRGMRYEAIFT
jgi:hypothetical protein